MVTSCFMSTVHKTGVRSRVCVCHSNLFRQPHCVDLPPFGDVKEVPMR